MTERACLQEWSPSIDTQDSYHLSKNLYRSGSTAAAPAEKPPVRPGRPVKVALSLRHCPCALRQGLYRLLIKDSLTG